MIQACLRRRRFLQAVAGGTACAGLPTRAATGPLPVVIADASPGHRIRPELFGSNLQWTAFGDGAWTNGAPTPGIVDAIAGAGIAQLRFPGGALANRYRWKTAIGPVERRASGLDFSWNPVPQDFGSDEFIALCRAAGATPVITVNPWVDPAEIADWVDYFNGSVSTAWGAQRAANGSAAPLRASWWEFGNETFDPNDPHYAGAADYAARYLAARKAMRRRDSSIRLGLVLEAAFQNTSWLPSAYPEMASWNDDVLAIAGSAADFASLHFYEPFDRVADVETLERLIFAGSESLRQNLAAVKSALARHGRAGMPLLLSEYGLNFADVGSPAWQIAGTDSALFAAATLALVGADPDFRGAEVWSLLNNGVWGSLYTDTAGLHRRPLFDAIEMLSGLAGTSRVAVDFAGPQFVVPQIGNIQGSWQVPTLIAIAGVGEEQSLSAVFVNRAQWAPQSLAIRTDGSYRQASVRSLVAAATYSLPNWIADTSSTLGRSRDPVWTVELPALSITRIDWTGDD